MTIADTRRGAHDTDGGIRRAAARLGLSGQETRRIVQAAESAPRDDVGLVSALADVLVERSLEHGWAAGSVRVFLEEIARASGWDLHPLALQVHVHATRNPSLLALSPA